ncbi:hypothetical protein CERSUDRAFT_101265 [Gelatoporia subvermispora B]|uniref:Uncharacterized protein n=1 Tax=Ceriporiopsis subvermispora (strain B) TaxID=914234 RepID=M2P5M8_CERS8|nr:hypothetical protein CERSUDRAFT_101265 [Gelatoporia subvermispora B]
MNIHALVHDPAVSIRVEHTNIGSSPFAGRVAEQMGNLEYTWSAYENALRDNPMVLAGLTQVAGIARIKEDYPKVSIRLI